MNIETVNKEEQRTPTIKNHPSFFRQILKVEGSSVTLNYLFDNIRNYTLAVTVMLAGLWLLSQDDAAFGIPYVNLIFGIHVALCGLVLMVLNFIHSIRTITKTGERLWLGYIIYFTLFIGSLEIVWVGFWRFLV